MGDAPRRPAELLERRAYVDRYGPLLARDLDAVGVPDWYERLKRARAAGLDAFAAEYERVRGEYLDLKADRDEQRRLELEAKRAQR